MLISLGIVFGDIGTSPLYVIKAILTDKVVSEQLIIGGLSCVIWTLILITTIKYVILALNADNNGEGGIFALYALVRKYKFKPVIYPAIIGCAMLIADGFITPPITISSAVEGITLLIPGFNTIPWVILCLFVLFSFQQIGTEIVGRTFGPIMLIWFSMIAVLGINQIIQYPEVLKALNPKYAIDLLVNYPRGFWLLGAVFLCTTGGEALYSDLGHVGKGNIRATWGFVLLCLMMSYTGQSAWLLNNHLGSTIPKETSIFYAIMPEWFLTIGIIVACVASFIASQALISGVFTLVNEAMKLHLWPRLKVNYPSTFKGQIYIPQINWILFCGCVIIVLIFGSSANMEAAYGMAIIIDMLMTSLLLGFYYKIRLHNFTIPFIAAAFFIILEGTFLIANLDKFMHGGWFSIMIGIIGATLVFVLYNAQKIKEKHINFVKLNEYIPILKDLQDDDTIPKEASHLVYLAMANDRRLIDSNIMYSILRKKPKRADVYWFVHVDIVDNPYQKSFHVDTIVPKEVFFVHLRFGFKVEHRVNTMFFEIVDQLVASGEVSTASMYPSMKKHHMPADFKFILLHTRVSADTELTTFERWVVRTYRMIKKVSLPAYEDFGLEVANVEEEVVPILLPSKTEMNLKREY
ncbi:MAG: KUP/HAK/KT family potassium transporter [Saprospiraceae bacterium]|nr:KUP/HAK/KT family potassium transporter [Saprospiraceae bacterium]